MEDKIWRNFLTWKILLDTGAFEGWDIRVAAGAADDGTWWSIAGVGDVDSLSFA